MSKFLYIGTAALLLFSAGAATAQEEGDDYTLDPRFREDDGAFVDQNLTQQNNQRCSSGTDIQTGRSDSGLIVRQRSSRHSRRCSSSSFDDDRIDTSLGAEGTPNIQGAAGTPVAPGAGGTPRAPGAGTRRR